MTSPAGFPAEAAGPSDPLQRAALTLDGLHDLPLEQHPEAFTMIDELLRAALEEPANPAPSPGAG